MQRALSMALLAAAAGCAPDLKFEFDDSRYSTLVVGVWDGTEWRPKAFDLRVDRERLVFPWARDEPVPRAYWVETLEELGVAEPAVAAPVDACSLQRLELAEAAVVLGPEGTPEPLDPCPESRRWCRERWAVSRVAFMEDPDPCVPWRPIDTYAVLNFDVQTQKPLPMDSRIAAGAATVVVALGAGRVVLGQLSGWIHSEVWDRNTQLSVFNAQNIVRDADTMSPTLTTTTAKAWTAGARRSDNEAWLGSARSELASFDADTGRITTVISQLASGRIMDLGVHRDAPERVFAATSSCALSLREEKGEGGGGGEEEEKWLTLIPPIERLTTPGVRGHCTPRLHFTAPDRGYAVGIAVPRTGEVSVAPSAVSQRVDRLIEIRGKDTFISTLPWPELPNADLRVVNGVASYEERAGVRWVVVSGAQYQVPPALDQPPYTAGTGASYLFLRRVEADVGAPWEVLGTSADADGAPISPVLVGQLTDAHPLFRGVLVGAYNSLLFFEAERGRRRPKQAFDLLDARWQPASQFPLIRRLVPDEAPDGRSGFIAASGEVFVDGRINFTDRFHWWRPRAQ